MLTCPRHDPLLVDVTQARIHDTMGLSLYGAVRGLDDSTSPCRVIKERYSFVGQVDTPIGDFSTGLDCLHL